MKTHSRRFVFMTVATIIGVSFLVPAAVLAGIGMGGGPMAPGGSTGSSPAATATPSAGQISQKQSTASYSIELDIEPAQTMTSPPF